MQYALLIYYEEARRESWTPEERGTIMSAHQALGADLHQQSKLLGGHALEGTSMATTVRIRDGKRLITDGPFAETKEQLGGLYVVEASDLDEAIGFAARLHEAHSGTIEVRPVMAVP